MFEKLFEMLCQIEEGYASARKKYADKIDAETFEEIVNADFTNSNKYTEWMAREIVNGASTEDVIKLINDFDLFLKHKLLQPGQTDIYQFDADQLKNLLKDIKQTPAKKHQEAGSQLVFDNEYCSIYNIFDYKASQWFCRGTRWCLGSLNTTYWEEKQRHGYYFYVLILKQPLKINLEFWERGVHEKPYKIMKLTRNAKIGILALPNIKDSTYIEIYNEKDDLLNQDFNSVLLKSINVPFSTFKKGKDMYGE